MVTHENKLSGPDSTISRGVHGLLPSMIVALLLIAGTACSGERTDFASIAPSDTLVYLESENLGVALGAIGDSPELGRVVEEGPDFSPLSGLRAGIFVTALDAAEDVVSDSGSELSLRPRFVAAVESDSWFWNPDSFLTETVGDFVSKSYGKDVKTEKSDEKDGTVILWKSSDGRSAFGAVRGSMVLFSNDRDALQAVLATRRGERDNISGNSALQRLRGAQGIASGYVSQAGVIQLSSFVGISTALSTTDDDEGRSFIARIVPDLVRANVKEILWTSSATESGITDRYEIVLADKVAEEMSVAAQSAQRNADELLSLVPTSARTVTRYGIASPSVAWSALVRNLSESTDILNGTVLTRAADGVFAPYGVASAGVLTTEVDGSVITLSLDDSGEQVVALFRARDTQSLRRTIVADFSKPAVSTGGFSLWMSDDGDFGYAERAGLVVVGESEAVQTVLSQSRSGEGLSKSPLFRDFIASKGLSVTVGRDAESVEQMIKALSLKGDKPAGSVDYLVSTEFNTRGMVRTTVSSFGLVGSLLSQFSAR